MLVTLSRSSRITRGAGIVSRVEVVQLRGVVVASLPFDLAEVDVVGHAEVVERHQKVGVQGVPETELACRASVEELLGDVDAVPAFRRRGQPQQLLRLQVIHQGLVRRGHGVVELVNDHDVEEVRFQLVNAERVEGLDGCEDVLPLGRLVGADVEFAESTVLHDVPVRAHRLFKDLLPVSDEEQLEIPSCGLIQAFVVQCGDDGLAGACCRDQRFLLKPLDRSASRSSSISSWCRKGCTSSPVPASGAAVRLPPFRSRAASSLSPSRSGS